MPVEPQRARNVGLEVITCRDEGNLSGCSAAFRGFVCGLAFYGDLACNGCRGKIAENLALVARFPFVLPESSSEARVSLLI
jgi:hypothetical protein